MRLPVRVLPRSSENKIVGTMANGVLKVKLTAAPVDGQANSALIDLLSRHYSTAKHKILLRRGFYSKNKLIEIVE